MNKRHDEMLRLSYSAINDPQPGDVWREMFAWVCIVVDVCDGKVLTLSGSTPISFPDEGVAEVRSINEFRDWMSGGRGVHHFVALCDRRGARVAGWLTHRLNDFGLTIKDNKLQEICMNTEVMEKDVSEDILKKCAIDDLVSYVSDSEMDSVAIERLISAAQEMSSDSVNPVIEKIQNKLAELKSDDRIKYAPALVEVNAPLALHQVAVGSKIEVLEWVLGMIDV